VVHAPYTYTACSPVWSVRSGAGPAAFNAMLRDGPDAASVARARASRMAVAAGSAGPELLPASNAGG